MRTAERVRWGMGALRNRIDYLYEEAEALEYEAQEKREEAEKLEKKMEQAEERRRNRPTEPAEIRCFCGEPLVALRPPPLGGPDAVGRRPATPVFGLPTPAGRPLDLCPGCRADLALVLDELAAAPSPEVPAEQLALPVEGYGGGS